MKYIAHRGLTQGPNKELENHPDLIRHSLACGYDCEIDLHIINGELFLGHDESQYKIMTSFIFQPGLWIHCKNYEALNFCQQHNQLNFFWHENDAYTLTSKSIGWAYPGKTVDIYTVKVMPEWEDKTLENTVNLNCYGVCSDYIEKIVTLQQVNK